MDEHYVEILDTAVEATGCDGGSVQVADDERDGLRLVASRGLHPASAAFWGFVDSTSSSVCGMALAGASRAVVGDVESAAGLAGSASLHEFRRSELRAIQSTPLVTGDDELVGMLSTYWRVPHEFSGEELQLVDLVATLADSDRLVLRCAWCGRIELDGDFTAAAGMPRREPPLLRERATHGICPDCLDGQLGARAAFRGAGEEHRLTKPNLIRELHEEVVASRTHAQRRRPPDRKNLRQN